MKVGAITSPEFNAKTTALRSQLEAEGVQFRPYADLMAWKVANSNGHNQNGSAEEALLLAGEFGELASRGWVTQILEADPSLPVVAWGLPSRLADAVKLMKQGAADVLEEAEPATAVVASLNSAVQRAAPQREAKRRLSDLRHKFASLTPAERAVLDALLAGNANKQIAQDLQIGLRTVELRRSKIMRKFEAHNLAELVKLVCEVRGTV
jgi:FixJ family two-component response regulator